MKRHVTEGMIARFTDKHSESLKKLAAGQEEASSKTNKENKDSKN